MKVLIGTACIAVIAFVGYFFWCEYEKSQATSRAAKATYQEALEQVRKHNNAECDRRVRDLTSWVNGKPTGETKSFAEAREYVDRCLNLSKGTDWYDKNIHVKYW